MMRRRSLEQKKKKKEMEQEGRGKPLVTEAYAQRPVRNRRPPEAPAALARLDVTVPE